MDLQRSTSGQIQSHTVHNKSNLEHIDTHQWVDALVGQIVISGGVVLDQFAILSVIALSNLVDLEEKTKEKKT